ncbi:MAG: TonB-dependent receptor [Rhizobacter sp.]
MHQIHYLLGSTVALLAGSAWSQGVADATLPPVSVRESRQATDVNTPAAVESTTRAQLEVLNVNSAEDSVKYLPNFATRRRYLGDRNSAIETRGTNNRMSARGLVLADGVLLSNFLGAQDQIAPRWSMVLPEEIERVDVVYGPYSALYSGNAMGAAVLFTTRMPKKFEADASFKVLRQTFNYLGTQADLDGNQLNAFIGNRSGDFSYLLGLGRLDSTSQPTGFVALPVSTTAATASDTVIASGAHFVQNRQGQNVALLGVGGGGIERTRQDEVKLKLGYDFTPEVQGRLTLASWRNDRQAGAAGDTTYLRDLQGNPVYAGNVNINGRRYNIPANSFSPRSGNEQHSSYAASLKSRYATGWNYELVASLYKMDDNLSRTASQAPPASFSGGSGTLSEMGGSGWKTWDMKLERRPQEGENHWLTFGYHYDTYEFKQGNFRADNWLGAASGVNSVARGSTETHAVYVQDAWRFAPDWKAVLGLRQEHWRASDASRVDGAGVVNTLPDRTESATSPKLALEYSPNSDWFARWSVAKATRFPTVVELFQGSVSPVVLINNNPNLRPERGVFTDFTVQRYWDNQTLRVTAYQERTRDTLFNQTNAGTVPSSSDAQNIDKVRVRGVELAWDARRLLPRLDVSASLAYNDAKVLENRAYPNTVGKNFPQIPRTRASLVAVFNQTDQLQWSLAGRHSGRQYATLDNADVNPSAYNGISSFNVFDAKVAYRLNPHTRLSFGIENLTNKTYFVNHPFPGRTYQAELKISL